MTTIDEDVGEGPSGHGLATNRADSRTDNEDVPDSINTMGPTKANKPTMTPRQNMRRDTVPPQFPVSTSVSVNSYGPGKVTNNDVGNIKNSNFSNMGNNNSKNYYQPKPKSNYTGYGQ